MALSSQERAASILTGPDGSAYPYSRDAALSTALLVMLPFDLLSLGSLRRALSEREARLEPPSGLEPDVELPRKRPPLRRRFRRSPHPGRHLRLRLLVECVGVKRHSRRNRFGHEGFRVSIKTLNT